jgi:LCP family protein required for cell wall assembly
MAIGDVQAGLARPYTHHRRRPLLAAFLSLIVPGLGQLYLGRWARGLAMVAIGLLIGAAALACWLLGPVFVLRLLVRPDVLLGLLVVNTLLFLFRLHSVVDAYRTARARLGVGVVAALFALTAAPHAVVGYYDFRSYDLLTSVFAEDEPDDPSPLVAEFAPAPPDEPAAVDPGPAEPPPAVSIPGATQPVEDGSDRGAVNPDRLDAGKRLNILLVGGDAGVGRSGYRSDTMIVFSIDPESAHTAVFSVPRNLQRVPIPESANTDLDEMPTLLNAMWQYASWYDWYPESEQPGATALKEGIGHLLGLEIDYYAAVDLRGFVEIVDALDGVTVTVQSYIYDAGVSSAFDGEAWTPINLAPGEHELDGRTALAYVRTRWATSDYNRMHRQRCLMAALAQQASLSKLLKAFPKLASTVKEFVLTDIPLRALPDLIELAVELDSRTMVGVSFVPPLFSGFADVDEIRAAVKEALRVGAVTDGDTGLVSLRGGCA